jgi:transposase
VGKVFVGHDWAEPHHDVHVEDEDGRRLGKAQLPEGVEGVARFHELVAPFVEESGPGGDRDRTDRGLFVGALVAAGYTVLAVNPMSTSRYRERHSTSGAKFDPGDALVLAELARTDAHNHRPIAGDSDLAEAVKVLARAHQLMIWTRQRQTNQLRSTLREFYPGAPTCLDDLHGGDALAVLAVAPTPTLGRGLSRSKIAAALRRGGRAPAPGGGAYRGDPGRPSGAQLAAPDVVSEAMGATVAGLVAVMAELSAQIGRLEESIADRFEKHPAAEGDSAVWTLHMLVGR